MLWADPTQWEPPLWSQRGCSRGAEARRRFSSLGTTLPYSTPSDCSTDLYSFVQPLLITSPSLRNPNTCHCTTGVNWFNGAFVKGLLRPAGVNLSQFTRSAFRNSSYVSLQISGPTWHTKKMFRGIQIIPCLLTTHRISKEKQKAYVLCMQPSQRWCFYHLMWYPC